MKGKDLSGVGHQPTRHLSVAGTQRTAHHDVSLQVIQTEIRSALSLNRRELLYGNLGPYVENRQFENLAIILDPIICSLTVDDDSRFPLCRYFEQIGRNSFCNLFSEFSVEGRSRIVEWFLKDHKVPFLTDLLYNLLVSAEGIPADSMKFKKAATQLIFSNLVYKLLNDYQMSPEKQGILAEVYYLNYEGEDNIKEIDIIIGWAEKNYDECCSKGSYVEGRTREIFGDILGRFREIFIERRNSSADDPTQQQ
jgi:hypothetical protein